MRVAIPLFDGITALDAIGPYETLRYVPGVDIAFVGAEPGQIRSDRGLLGLTVDLRYEDVPDPDVVVMPGGPGSRPLIRDERVLRWLRTAHQTTRMTTSVCTGSLVLAAAGLLDGLTATTHWTVYDDLRRLGAVPTDQRVVEHLDRRVITAAGVSSGIDMALRLLELLFDDVAAQAAQLMIEYDPQPPFDAGSPAKAGEDVKARLAEYRLAPTG